MSDDLVKRLRWSAEGWDAWGEPDNARQDREAADRIEQLETALKFYTKANPDFLQTADWILDCGEKRYGYVAREALQGIKDER